MQECVGASSVPRVSNQIPQSEKPKDEYVEHSCFKLFWMQNDWEISTGLSPSLVWQLRLLLHSFLLTALHVFLFFSCYHACPNNFHLGNMIKVLTVCVFLVHLLEIQSRASPIWHTLMVFIDFGMITRGFVQVSPSIEIFQNHLENFLCTSHIEGMY